MFSAEERAESAEGIHERAKKMELDCGGNELACPPMKSLNVELPDQLADQVGQMIREGWFLSANELVRTALVEFLRSRQTELQERFQREDIAWAVAEAKPGRK